MRAVMWAVVAIPFALLALAPAGSHLRADDTPAVKAARARQERFKTLAIKFKQTEVIADGGAAAVRPPLKEKAPPREKTTTLESTNRLVIDGEKVLYEDNHPRRFVGGKVARTRVVTSSNGSTAKILFPHGISGRGDALGLIQKGTRLDFVQTVELRPITLTFRALSPAMGSDTIRKLEPSGATLQIDGALCQEYVVRHSAQAEDHYWLDPQKDHVIRRIRWQRRNRSTDQLDIAYRQRGPDWVPSSWVRIRSSPEGAVRSTVAVEVLEMEYNAVQPAEQFELRFPPGTTVSDYREAPNLKQYRVESDGSLREVADASGRPSQPKESWFGENRGLLIAFGVALLVQIVAYVWWRKRHKPA